MPFLKLTFFWALIATLVLSGCQSNSRSGQGDSKAAISKLVSPKNNRSLRIGDPLEFTLEISSKDLEMVDSIVLHINDQRIGKFADGTLSYSFDTKSLPTGKVQSITKVHRKDGKTENKLANLKVLSDIKPPTYGFETIAAYPHNINSYTQGLIFHEGYLYESIGQYGKSKLMRIDLESGEAVNEYVLDKAFFAEGLTLFNNELIQITWQEGTAFRYDLGSLQPKRTMKYNGEGWGLTTNGKQIIMSNGSNELLFLNPQTFKMVRQLEVMDDKGPVTKLNELEYVNGEIWANIYDYKEFKIVRIDEKTGKVLAYINLTGILETEDYHGSIDVLNGIAYDSENDRLFVTGKNYPRLFEIKVLD